MTAQLPIPEGYTARQGDFAIPFIDNFFSLYERLYPDGADIGAWVTAAYCNAGRMAHGGFLLSLGDYATTRAAFQVAGTTNRFTVHMNLSMNFYAPAPLGSWLEARARVKRQGRSVIFTSCDYFADGALIGRAEAILKSSERRPSDR